MKMKKEITILEDDESIRDICTYLFDEEGYKVNAFSNIADFMKGSGIPDLFLLDIMLPDGNGLLVCEKLKNDPMLAKIPVIMMSAHLQKTKMMERCPADDFIEKPFDIALLLDRVANLVHRPSAPL